MLNKLQKKFGLSLNDNSVKSKLFKGVFWAFFGTVISKGLLFLAFIIISHYLSTEDYGKLGVIRSTITTFALFSVASFGVTATKYLAIYLSEDKDKALRILSMTRVFVFILSFIISLFIFLFAEKIATIVLGDSSLKEAVIYSSVAVFFTAMNGLQTGILAGLEKFKYISAISISNGILSFIVLLFAVIYYGLFAGILALVLIQILLWLESLYYLNKSFKEEGLSFKLLSFNKEFVIIKEFTIPSFVAGIILPPVLYLCDLFIIKTPNGFSHLGIYKAAFNFSIITITLNGILGQVLYPFVMKNIKNGSRKLEFFNQVIPFLIAIFLNVPFILAPELFAKVFGKAYNTQEMYLAIIFVSLSTILIGQKQGISRNFASKNYMWWSFTGNFIWGLSALLLVYYFSGYGAVGISAGLFIAYFINTLVFLPFYINRGLIEKEDLFNKFSILIYTLIIAGSSMAFLDLSLITRILSGIIIMLLILYISYCWLKKGLTNKIA